MNISLDSAKGYVNSMLDLLYKKDNFLLQKMLNITERAITHRMGMYLQHLLPDYDVDCEYNRMGKKTDFGLEYTDGDYFAKTVCLSDGVVPDDDDQGSKVFPDIIVHKRGTSKNYIIIEVKIAWKNRLAKQDIKKLKAYMNDLKYNYAFYVELGERRESVLINQYENLKNI